MYSLERYFAGFRVLQEQIDSPNGVTTRDFSPKSLRNVIITRGTWNTAAARRGVCNADQHRDRMHRFEFTWIGKRTVNEVYLIVIWYSHSWRTYPRACIKFMPEALIAIERAGGHFTDRFKLTRNKVLPSGWYPDSSFARLPLTRYSCILISGFYPDISINSKILGRPL